MKLFELIYSYEDLENFISFNTHSSLNLFLLIKIRKGIKEEIEVFEEAKKNEHNKISFLSDINTVMEQEIDIKHSFLCLSEYEMSAETFLKLYWLFNEKYE